jgi:hypothetical protein
MEHFGIAEAESGTSYAPENENHARNEREEESIEVGTNQKEYGIFDEAEQTELNEERYKSMTIKEMILEGITDEEIMRIKECNRQSIYTARNKLKKEGKLTGAAVVKENETILPHDCKDVIKTCAYSSRLGAEYFCDYIGKAGKRRNCKPGACTAYRRG